MNELKPRDFLLQLVDPSNWHSMQGDEYRGYADAMEQVHELILDMWDDFDAPIDRWKESDSLMQCRIDDLKAENEALKAEIERCHERLEITHYFTMEKDENGNFKRVDMEDYKERKRFPDAVECRDSLITLLEMQIEEMKAVGNSAALGDRHE